MQEVRFYERVSGSSAFDESAADQKRSHQRSEEGSCSEGVAGADSVIVSDVGSVASTGMGASVTAGGSVVVILSALDPRIKTPKMTAATHREDIQPQLPPRRSSAAVIRFWLLVSSGVPKPASLRVRFGLSSGKKRFSNSSAASGTPASRTADSRSSYHLIPALPFPKSRAWHCSKVSKTRLRITRPARSVSINAA